MLKIWVVEDNPQQRADIIEAIEAKFQTNLNLVEITTEYAFRQQLAQLKQVPDLIIMDVMLPWTRPAPDAPKPPDDVEREGFYRAGIRCVHLTRATAETGTTKIILLSNLDRADLKDDLEPEDSCTVHLPKNNNYSELIDLVHQLINN